MLHACLPWQWAERDEGYYTRTRHALSWLQILVYMEI